MRLIERLRKIDNYFKNMPQKVFEEELIKAGFYKYHKKEGDKK